MNGPAGMSGASALRRRSGGIGSKKIRLTPRCTAVILSGGTRQNRRMSSAAARERVSTCAARRQLIRTSRRVARR